MEVKATANMLGLFSSSYFEKGETVLIIEGLILQFPTRTTIQIGLNKHIDVDAPAKFINHSCTPNCEVRSNKLLAVKNIMPGDEITFDYQKIDPPWQFSNFKFN